MRNEKWRCSLAKSENHDTTNDLSVSSATKLASNSRSVLQSKPDNFGNKTFLNYRTKEFPQSSMSPASDILQSDLNKTIKCTTIINFLKASKVLNSHVIFKIKHNDDGNINV